MQKRSISFCIFALFFAFSPSSWAQTPVLNVDDPGFGAAVDGGLDVNGDEIPDLIAGNPSFDSGHGKVKIYSGVGGALLQSFDGPSFTVNDRYGSAVAFLPDLDGDEISDVLVGAPQPPQGGVFGGPDVPVGPGYAMLYSGDTGAALFMFTGQLLLTGQTDRFGKAVAWAGDLDLDGYPDFIIGAPGAVDGAGLVYLFSGQSGFPLGLTPHLGTSLSELGTALSGGFDINGDGKPDYLAGAPRDNAISSPSNSGAVFVFSGADQSILYQIGGPATVPGAGAGDRFGSSVVCLPDLNNDGRADFAVGAPFSDAAGTPGSNNTGAVYVFSGMDGSMLYEIRGDSTQARFGTSLSRAGDVNHDGIEDFVVGATEVAPDLGYASIRSGANGAELCRFHGQLPGDGTGNAVGPGGNLDATGGDEIVVGSPGATSRNLRVVNCKEPKRPSVQASNGNAGFQQNFPNPQIPVLIPGHEHHGSDSGASNGAQAGSSVAIVDDLNADGYDDYLVGSPYQGSFDQGQAVLYSGKTAMALASFNNGGTDYRVGLSVANAGDVDADGVEDLMYSSSGAMGPGANRVTVVSGASWNTTLAVLQASIIGGGVGFTDEFAEGRSLAAAGDVNHDGYGDILIGDSRYCYSGCWENNPQKFVGMGAAWVISGEWIAKTHLLQTPQTPQVIRQILGTKQFQHLGSAVAGIGDVNGDGFDDFCVGSIGDSLPGSPADFRGSVAVYSGSTGAVLWKVYGPQKASYLGWSVCAAGDLDGDGVSELLLGAPGGSAQSLFESSAQLRNGRTGALLKEVARMEDDRLGVAVSGRGDLDGDLVPDLAIGASPLAGNGYVLVISGADLTKSSIVLGAASGDFFGSALSIAGDINADGRADLLIGAPADSSWGFLEGSARAFFLTPNPGAGGGLITPASGSAQGPQ